MEINLDIETINIMLQIIFDIKEDRVVNKCKPTLINDVFSNQPSDDIPRM